MFVTFSYCVNKSNTFSHSMSHFSHIVPHTAMRSIDYSQLPADEREVMRNEDNIASIQFPVMRTCGNATVNGPIFDLMRLVNWVRQAGTDPITRRQINWNDFEAIEWLHRPVGLHRRYNIRFTNKILMMLQRGVFGAHIPSPESDDDEIAVDDIINHQNEQHNQNFRERMAEIATVDPLHDWVMEYWINHPYDVNTDSTFVFQNVPAVWRNFTDNDEVRRRLRLQLFRMKMADFIATRPLGREENEYWSVHPISREQDLEEVCEHYGRMLHSQRLALERMLIS